MAEPWSVGSARWSLRLPVALHVGRGAREALADAEPGPWLMVSSRRGRLQAEADEILAPLLMRRVALHVDDVPANPSLGWLDATARRLRDERATISAVVGVGGGSVLDAAKVIAALISPREHVPLGTLLQDSSALDDSRLPPILAVATTAGTGSEVTPFATVWNAERSVKASLASEAIRPALAIVDADLTDELPRDATVATGLDAVNQAAESIWNRNANPVTLELAACALELGLPALERLLDDTTDRGARSSMAEASLLAGLAISHTRTALCHAMSYPITAHFGVAHGIACAFTMSAVAAHVAAADDGRLDRAATRLGAEGAEGLAARFGVLQRRAGVAHVVRDAVGDRSALLALLPEMHTSGRSDNALRAAGTADLERILKRAWDGA